MSGANVDARFWYTLCPFLIMMLGLDASFGLVVVLSM
jgi:hypothetical protein